MKYHGAVLLAAGWMAVLPGSRLAAAPDGAFPADPKPRVVVMTDIGGDPDDEQSIVRFLLYACDVDVEGLCTGFGHGHDRNTRPDLLRKAIQAYGEVWPNLRRHRPDYPPPDRLMALVKDGHNGDPHAVGPGMDSEASSWIIRVVDRDDPRPVWFTIWGGPRELAQALWKVRQTRSAAEVERFVAKIRVHSIADQDRTAGWIKEHHPELFYIFSKDLFRGIWKGGDQDLVSPGWLARNVREGHGALGAIYPPKAAGKDGVKEGDTPSFFHVLPNGLGDPEEPGWGGWGGRFRPAGRGRAFVPADDLRDGRPDPLYGIQRWRAAYQHEFAARVDWCVRPVNRANHAPRAVLNGDATRRVLRIAVEPGAAVTFLAAGSVDPDGDRLAYRWWVYREAGTVPMEVPMTGADTPSATVSVPARAAGREIHLVLEVTDAGDPPLTAYRRVIVNVRGTRIPLEADAFAATGQPRPPVTRLDGPPAATGPWRFYRGININGPAASIDGQAWDGDAAPGFACRDPALVNDAVALRPPTDPARAAMIRAFRWGKNPRATLSSVPAGTYAVYAYVWEETNPQRITVLLNDNVVAENVDSGPAGTWQRLGPWVVDVRDGRIELTARGGDANLCGLEIWRREGAGGR